jgi:hypothetical protein
MTNDEIIKEAIKGGYLKASRINPSHLLYSEKCPTLIIPDACILSFLNEDELCLMNNGVYTFSDTNSNSTWTGIVYSKKNGKWAKIVESYPEKTPVLREFPRRGVCWNHNEDLFRFLTKRKDLHVNTNLRDYVTHPPKGLAWSDASCWGVSTASGQPEYSIDQLIPFLSSRTPFKRVVPEEYPLTPEECYFPEKWCIKIDTSNINDITTFFRNHISEYKGCSINWDLHTNYYFHYPQFTSDVHSSAVKKPEYTTITIDQFKKHVLTHTDKQTIINPLNLKENGKQQEGGNSIEVQRSNLTVRDTDPIRAVGIRCSKIQIKVGSGYLPD